MSNDNKLICDMYSWDIDKIIESVEFVTEFIKSDNFIEKLGGEPSQWITFVKCLLNNNKHDESSKLHIMEVLIKNGFDVTAKYDNGYALGIAAESGLPRVVKLILDNNAEVNFFNSNGLTPLHEACRANKPNSGCIKLLLDAKADINARVNNDEQESALMIAANYGNAENVALLLQYGAKINDVNYEEKTALHIASQKGRDKAVEVLLNNGADINGKSKNGNTALNYACTQGHSNVAELLINRGAEVNIVAKGCDHDLLIACKRGHESIVNLLLERGAKPDIAEDSELGQAAYYGHTNIMKNLIKHGAKINWCTSDGYTPLLSASLGLNDNLNIDVFNILLEAKANVDAQVSISSRGVFGGYTALMFAAENGQGELVKLLLQNSAQPSLKNASGETAIDIANKKKKLKKIADLIGKFAAGKSVTTSKKGKQAKPESLIINTIVVELEREDGQILLGKKKQKGYAIYENKAAYKFIYQVTDKKSALNALNDLKSGELKLADETESEGGENKSITYFDNSGKELENIDDFTGNGESEVVEVTTPYGYSEVILELDNLERICGSSGDVSDPELCFNALKKDKSGAKIIELLTNLG